MVLRTVFDNTRDAITRKLARLRALAGIAETPKFAPDVAQLEERILLSAAPMLDMVHADQTMVTNSAIDLSSLAEVSDPLASQEFRFSDELTPSLPNWDGRTDQAEPTAEQSTRFELAFVDAGAEGYDQLVDDLLEKSDSTAEVEVYLLDRDRDGVQQISEILAGYEGVDAVHLVSHGSNGQVKLGNQWLTAENLNGYSGEIASWNNALSDGADLLIYGCDLAATSEGQALAEALAALCDCDVAASIDDTGNAALGGDWDLEYATGTIEADLAFSVNLQSNWSHLLALETLRDEFNSVSYSNNNGSVAWTNDWQEIGESNGVSAGNVQVWTALGQQGLQIWQSGRGAMREADLSSATTATLSFDYARFGLDDPGDFIVVEVSSNGGASWFELDRFDGPADDAAMQSASYDISGFIASNTQIRFVSSGMNATESLFVDNFQIEYNDLVAPGGVETNLNLWLRADAGVTTAGANVTQWDNQVLASPLTDVTGSGITRPSLVASTLNFNPVISFDGFNDRLSATSVLGSTLFSSNASSIYTVTSLNGTGDVILQWRDDTGLGNANRVSIEDELRFDYGDLTADQYTTPSPAAGYHILNAVASPSTSPISQSFYIDGLESPSGLASGDNPLNVGNTGNFTIGNYFLGGFAEDIDLGEVIIFGSDLNAAEQARVDSYLAIKYGITLDQTAAPNYVDSAGNIIWDATTNIGYDNDIAIIGRDLVSSLDQSQSRSINSDAIVTMSAASDQQNREFLTWSNDGGALSEVAGEPAGVLNRLSRMWRVNETGEVGATTIEFDLTGITYTGTTASDFQLIVDTVDDFSSASTIVATSYNGGSNIVTFTGVNLTDGDFFALGTESTTNNAPVLADTVVNLNSVNEDAGTPLGAVGTSINSIVDLVSPIGGQDNVTDADGGSVTGLAIIGADTSNGVWHFSIDNGANWNPLGAVGNASARVLAANGATRIYFEPDPNYNGSMPTALTFRAWDQTDGSANGAGGVDTGTGGGASAFSITTDTAALTVNAVNDLPTLTTFASAVETTNEDTEVEITLAELATQGDEADIDGTVDAFVVKSIASGTLRIGATAGAATPWAAGTNDTIDATNNAYWMPDLNVTGPQNALAMVAQDNLAAESIGNVLAQINVNAVNDLPTLTAFAAVIDTTLQDTEIELTLAELAAQGDEADVDGTVDAFVVKSIASGTLNIGATAGTATPWAAGTNDTIDASNNAYWTPALAATGTINAFNVVAEDNLNAESVGNVMAQVQVTANNPPTLTTFASAVETTNEDTEVEVTLAELAAQGDEADIDGTVDAFVVKSIASGTLRIGATAGAATPWAAGTNDTIDATHNAYWTPDLNVSGPQNALAMVAQDNLAAESIGNVLAQINVNAVNDLPTLTAFATVLDTTLQDTEIELTLAELAAQGDEADVDGTVDAFVVKSIASGTLNIGATAGTATPWAAGTNDTIDASNNAYWTPALAATGTINAFNVVAEDNSNAESVGNVMAQVQVTANNPPTLTTFASAVETTNEDTEVEVTLAELAAQGDEADIDGTVDAFVVKSIASGTLRIGATAGVATPWAAGTNDTIDATNNAYWTPDLNVSGPQSAFALVAKDNLAAESIGNVLAQINVNAVNDLPTLTAFATVIDTTLLDTEVELTLAELAAQGDEADVDGTVDAFVVKSIASGTLNIGATAGTATPWAAGTNDTIDASNNAYWTPALAATGTINAFNVVAEDNLNAESVGNVMAQVQVTANNPPTLTTFASAIETTNEDTEVEVTLAELAAQGDEADIDGTVDAFVVKSIASGTLRIGATAGAATPWAAGTNDTIDATNNAYWTPDLNVTGPQNAFALVAKDNLAAESVGNVLAQINVNAVNDLPTLTAFATVIDTTLLDTEVELALAELAAQGDEADVDGTVDAFVVKSIASGTLNIGATAGTATSWTAGTNDTIDASNNAYWTPALAATGTINTFNVVAEDNLNAESVGNVMAQVQVTANNPPTLTTFASAVETTNEDAEVEVTLAELASQGDETDIDGTVDAFVVKSIPSGTLRIGATAGVATPWAAGTNDTIDATNNAYWTPDLNVTGPQNAFALVAKDNLAAESVGNVLAQINVNAVNDKPLATGDSFSVDADDTLTVPINGVLANDSDVEGDPLDAIQVSGPTNGTLMLNLDGSFTYTPDNGFTGADSFRYVASDGMLNSDAVTVNITVLPVGGPAPVASPTPAPTTASTPTPTLVPAPTAPGAPVLPPGLVPPPANNAPPVASPAPSEPSPSIPAGLPEIDDEEPLSSTPFTNPYEPLRKASRTVRKTPRLTTFEPSNFQITAYDTGLLWDDMSQMQDDIMDHASAPFFVAGSVAGFTGSLTVGYVLWTVRSGWLASCLLAQMPAWRLVDPLVVLQYIDDEPLDDEESLESMLENDEDQDDQIQEQIVEAPRDPNPTR